LKLTWHSVATYDRHSEDHTTIGGTNNGGYGGATMRFQPESDDLNNRGLLEIAERVLNPIKTKHPKVNIFLLIV
jgi:catalase (peroxidase I)